VSLRAKAEQWLLRPEEVSVGKRMGQGAGGVIYHAKWRGLDAVAKMLRPEGERDGNIARQVAPKP
jgi:predicted Ser/Thr protein kinase